MKEVRKTERKRGQNEKGGDKERKEEERRMVKKQHIPRTFCSDREELFSFFSCCISPRTNSRRRGKRQFDLSLKED